MASTASRTPELALPVASLAALTDALMTRVGAEAAAQALREAGHAAGDALHRILTTSGNDVAGMPADRFWQHLSRLFSSRGWGTFAFSQPHPGVGALDTTDWFEARPEAGAAQPCCHFTTGVLANVLGTVAGSDVAVMEVECRTRGDQRCRFLIGGADAVFAVYERMAAGDRADTAIAQLG
ncbi:MAG TPA: V4R domain-containing protein [Longimicrobiales bacterium]|nr:V4R domain-containing protein [Longimicrobiales bacterium]